MMKYKRLTKRTEGGKVYANACFGCADGVCRWQHCATNESVWRRLADLEDKIEQGTLIELPCKVGDTVYYETFINSKSQGIKPHKVIGFVLEVITQDICGFGCTAVPIKDFGKDVFFTREEAEKKLKELQE